MPLLAPRARRGRVDVINTSERGGKRPGPARCSFLRRARARASRAFFLAFPVRVARLPDACNRVLIEPTRREGARVWRSGREGARERVRAIRLTLAFCITRFPFTLAFRARSRPLPSSLTPSLSLSLSLSLYNEADLSRAFNEALYDESRLNFGLCASALKGIESFNSFVSRVARPFGPQVIRRSVCALLLGYPLSSGT